MNCPVKISSASKSTKTIRLNDPLLSRLVVFVLVFSPQSNDSEVIVDSQFGFRLKIPGTFALAEGDEPHPDAIHSYLRMPESEQPWIGIEIQRMRMVIPIHDRMAPSDLSQSPELRRTLQELTWKAYQLDVVRTVVRRANETDRVHYGIQYPLSEEAVQLTIGGPLSADTEIRQIFVQVASSFENLRPLHQPRPRESHSVLIGLVAILVSALVLVLSIAFGTRHWLASRKG